MIRSTGMLAGAALTALGLGVATMIVTPSGGSARAVPGYADAVSIRIDGAFALAPVAGPAPAVEAAARRAARGDLIGTVCADQKWPEISARCLGLADGVSRPVVRSVTIGYPTDTATTVLVRLPAQQVASR